MMGSSAVNRRDRGEEVQLADRRQRVIVNSAASSVTQDLLVGVGQYRVSGRGGGPLQGELHIAGSYRKGTVAASSPLDEIRVLKAGWAGPRSEPPSEALIERADMLWSLLDGVFPESVERPRVSAGFENFIAFKWRRHYPKKELHVWLHDDVNFNAE